MSGALLTTSFRRYLFNAGEGFQRFCVEHKIKMNRVSSCLVTRLTGDATGGLPGTSSIDVSLPDYGPVKSASLSTDRPLKSATLSAHQPIKSATLITDQPELRPYQELEMPPILLLNAATSPAAFTQV